MYPMCFRGQLRATLFRFMAENPMNLYISTILCRSFSFYEKVILFRHLKREKERKKIAFFVFQEGPHTVLVFGR